MSVMMLGILFLSLPKAWQGGILAEKIRDAGVESLKGSN
jgi:hypothetical protein